MTRSMVRLVLGTAIALAALGLLHMGEASAETARKERSDALSETAYARYQLGRWDEAITLWEQAYAEFPSPEILFNLAQSHRQLKHYEKAVFYYRGYLRDAPAAANRRQVEELVRELDQVIEQQKAAGEHPPLDIKGPKGALSITSESHEIRADSPPPWYADRWGWVLSAGGVAVAGIGVGVLVSAAMLEDEADRANEFDAGPLYERADSRRQIGIVVTSVGAVVIAIGVIKLAVRPHSRRVRRDDGKPTVSVGVRSMSIGWRF